jgi:hypothetical protein
MSQASTIVSQFTSRRSMLKALSFFPFVGATAAMADPTEHDPVLAALDAYAQARADHELAYDECKRIDREHSEICHYRPRVKVGTNHTFGYDEFPDTYEDVFAYSEAEIARYNSAKAGKLKAALDADRARSEVELERIGFNAAEEAYDTTADRLAGAESAVLTAVPTTEAGALALATFTAKIADQVTTTDVGIACRTLGDWLISRRARVGV